MANSRLSLTSSLALGVVWWRITVKLPSMFSPKWWAKISFAWAELVPGTVSEVVNRSGSLNAERAPRRIIATQHAMTTTRQRTTARVQRSSTIPAYLWPGNKRTVALKIGHFLRALTKKRTSDPRRHALFALSTCRSSESVFAMRLRTKEQSQTVFFHRLRL